MNRLVNIAAPLMFALAISVSCSSTSARAAFTVESSSANMLTRKGYELVQAGSYAQAIVVLKHAVRANPNDLNARRYLIYALVRTDDFVTASQQLRIIAKATKLTSADYFLSGSIEVRFGNTDRALQEYRAALAIEPEMGAAKAGIIELFVLASDFQGATYLCKDCIDKSRSQAELNYFNKLMQSVKERERIELAQTVDPNARAQDSQSSVPSGSGVVPAGMSSAGVFSGMSPAGISPGVSPAGMMQMMQRPLIPTIIQPPPQALPKISPIADRAKA